MEARPNVADVDAAARAAGNRRPDAIALGRALFATMWPAQIVKIRIDGVGSNEVAGIVISGVKFHGPLDPSAFTREVNVIVATTFAASPVEEVDVWATVPLATRPHAVVAGRPRGTDVAYRVRCRGVAHRGCDRGRSPARRARRLLGSRVARAVDRSAHDAGQQVAVRPFGSPCVYRKSTLASGVRVITEAMPHVRSASLGIWADVGSAAERAEQRGVSHLVEHMLFKGTQRRDAREIAETMDGVGGNLNAFTDKEATCYYAKVIDRHVPLAIDVLSDMFLHSVFAPSELAKEQKVVLEEIRMYDDSPDDMIHDVFIRTMWSGSNLGEPTIGYAETVSALTSDDLRDHMRARYAPNTVVFAAAGNVDHDDIVARVERAFVGFVGTGAAPTPDRPVVHPATLVRRKETEQAYIVLGVQGLSVRDDRRYALSVLDTVFGGGMSSRLFQEVREKRGLAYSVYSFQQGYRDAGLFGVSAGTSPDRAQECVDVVVGEFERMASDGATDAEVHLAREHIKGSLTLSLESSASRMLRLGRGELGLGEYLDIETIERHVDAVDTAAVNALARELFTPAALGLCVLGPLDEAEIRWQRSLA